MTVLIVLAAILFALFLFSLLPVRIFLQYQDKFTVTLRFLFLKKDLLADTVSQIEQKPVEEIEPEPEEQEKHVLNIFKDFFKREGFGGFMEFLSDAMRLMRKLGSSFLKHMQIREFDLHIIVHGEDAGEAAVRYGEVSALASAVYSTLFTLKKCRKPYISVDLDYEDKTDDSVNFFCTLSIKILFLLILAIKALKNGLPLFRRFQGKTVKNRQKKER